MEHRAGFVNILGNPNVGKSTLMNRLVGEKLSIITSKSQTTRHRIKGIVNGDDYQIVFSDTPGVVKPSYKMQEYMLDFSKSAIIDADIILYVTDVVEDFEKNADFIEKVKQSKAPILLVINKIDLTTADKLDVLFDRWKQILPQAEIFPLSATENFNVDNLYKRILELLPVGEPYFDKEDLTDMPARFFVTEIIREKILLNYEKEVPYSVEVVVEEFKEEAKRIHIMAVIHVEREFAKRNNHRTSGSLSKKSRNGSPSGYRSFFRQKSIPQSLCKSIERLEKQRKRFEEFRVQTSLKTNVIRWND